jgi:hypothetical protein
MTQETLWRDLRGVQNWASERPLWDHEHPLFQYVGAARTHRVRYNPQTTKHTLDVEVPDLGDAELEDAIAYCAAYAGLKRASRFALLCFLESLALLYDHQGPEIIYILGR